MADNLVDLVSNYFDPDVSSKLAASLGVNQDQIQAIIDQAIPATLAGVAGVASTSAGAQKIADTIGAADQDMLNNLGSMVADPNLATSGLAMLGSLVGSDKVGAITTAVASASGTSAAAAQRVVGVLGPATFGALGQLDPSAWSSGEAIAKTFAEQRASIAAQLPPGLGAILAGGAGLASAAGAVKSAATAAASSMASHASPAPTAPPRPTSTPSQPSSSGGLPSWVWALIALVIVAGLAYWWFKIRGA
jgi:hypothetical protein